MSGTIAIWDLSPQSNDEDDDNDTDDDHTSNAHHNPSSTNVSRTLLCQMEKVHPGGVCSLSFLPHEPLLLSSGLKSNSLVMHLFDNPNHSGRILRQRVGHTAPPQLVRYQYSSGGVLASMADGTDAEACQILSCGGKGDRSLRLFSTARSVLDREYSQGKGLVKKAKTLGLKGGKADLRLNEIIGLATGESKNRDWGDLVTIHKDHAMAYVWSTDRKAQSGPILRQDHWNVSAMKIPPPTSVHATTVAVSSCGNFAVIGTKGGVIYKYNIQSGMARGSYPRNATTDNKSNQNKNGAVRAGNITRTIKMMERTLKIHKLHKNDEVPDAVITAEKKRMAKLQLAQHKDAAVTGLAIDSLNKSLISVGADSKLIMWSFSTHSPHKRSPVQLPAPAAKMIYSRDSGLIAVALQDFSVILFDCSTLTIVRIFGRAGSNACHLGPITDLAFGPDGRKLFTSSLDGTLRVWDVPTNTCVDWMTFANTPISLTLSCTGEFLATSHLGQLGISLWCDRSFFQTVHLDGAAPPTEPLQMDEPASAVEHTKDTLFGESPEDRGKTMIELPFLQNNNTHCSEEAVDKDDDVQKGPPQPKQVGLITLSGLPAAHWKNLFHLELVKERNKPTEAPKKPPNAPFFLQWRGGENNAGSKSAAVKENVNTLNATKDNVGDDEWAAAWSDDDADPRLGTEEEKNQNTASKRKFDSDLSNTPTTLHQPGESGTIKRNKVTHARSDLASLLLKCSATMNYSSSDLKTFEPVTQYISSIGPAAIDVAFSTLCHGMHDLDAGLPLLHLAAMWLLEACRSRQNYEAVNSYLHRFLHLHAATISGINTDTEVDSNKATEEDKNNWQQQKTLLETITKLRFAQKAAALKLQNKMQHTMCLLRHFSRMV